MSTMLVIPDGFHDLGWQLGYVIFFCVGIVGLVPLILGIVQMVRHDFMDDWYGAWLICVCIGGIAALCLFVPAGAAIIQGPEYMKDYEFHGKVTSASNKFVDGTGDITNTNTPVVRIEGFPTPLFLDDTRILGMVGQEVELRCNPVWHYHANATYDCVIKSFD